VELKLKGVVSLSLTGAWIPMRQGCGLTFVGHCVGVGVLKLPDSDECEGRCKGSEAGRIEGLRSR